MLAVTANESAWYITEPIANQSEGALVTSRKLERVCSHSNEGTTLELTMVQARTEFHFIELVAKFFLWQKEWDGRPD